MGFETQHPQCGTIYKSTHAIQVNAPDAFPSGIQKGLPRLVVPCHYHWLKLLHMGL